MLKIRQSCHGDGGIEGYKFEVFNDRWDYIGELKDFPSQWDDGDIFTINSEPYTVIEAYDSDLPHEEIEGVIYIVLAKCDTQVDHDLGYVIGG